MDWVNRQVEEIVTKLTSFPSLIIILPNFSGVTDYSWGDFFKNLSDKFNDEQNDWSNKQANKTAQIKNLESQKEAKSCDTITDMTSSDYYDCKLLSMQVSQLTLEKDYNPNQIMS